MRIARLTTFVAVATALSLAPAYAQAHGGSHAGSPTVAHGNPHTTTTASNTPASTATTGGTTTGTTSTATHTTVPISPIAAKISSHPQLAAKCTTLLPKGTTLNQAAAGFRNQGQFIAALHVSRNLHIPFAQLKATMLGTPTSTTGSSVTSTPKPMSLGQAIHTLRPSVDSDDATERATTQASTDLKTTSTSTSTHR